MRTFLLRNYRIPQRKKSLIPYHITSGLFVGLLVTSLPLAHFLIQESSFVTFREELRKPKKVVLLLRCRTKDLRKGHSRVLNKSLLFYIGESVRE
uniref:Leucine rich ORF n=1 Tax=Saccharomyces douglasii TaxID=46617 RepID=Q08998_9SACH|nr:probable NAM2 leader peptide - yeast (Saccharomyces sp.) [Saccharomyces sp.]CAA31342.1 unnamed protein product [Saccharomyces douglasii]